MPLYPCPPPPSTPVDASNSSLFLDAFFDKDPVSPLLKRIPLYAVLVEDVGERGSHWVATKVTANAPTHVPTDLPTHPPTFLPTYIPTCLPTYLPIYLPVSRYPPTDLPADRPIVPADQPSSDTAYQTALPHNIPPQTPFLLSPVWLGSCCSTLWATTTSPPALVSAGRAQP